MGYSTKQLIEIGSRLSTGKLLQQATASLDTARAHQDRLARLFPPARLDELEQNINRITELRDAHAEGRMLSRAGTSALRAVMRQAFFWVQDLLAVADNAFEEAPETRDLFHGQPRIRLSLARASERMRDLLVLAGQYRTELDAWGFSDQVLDQGHAILAELVAASSVHERAMGEVSPQLGEMLAAKATTYLLLKRLVRAARIEFRDEQAIPAALAFDILNRHTRRPVTGKAGSTAGTFAAAESLAAGAIVATSPRLVIGVLPEPDRAGRRSRDAADAEHRPMPPAVVQRLQPYVIDPALVSSDRAVPVVGQGMVADQEPSLTTTEK